MTFPFDPNRDPNGSLERKAPEVKNRRLPEQFRQAVCAFLFFFHPTLAMKPLIFCAASFFMPAVTWVYTSSENSAEA